MNFVVLSRMLLRGLELLRKVRQDDANSQQKYEELQKKIQRLRVSGAVMSISSLVFVNSLPITFFVIGTIPYCWIFNVISIFSLHLMHITVAIFLQRSVASKPSDSVGGPDNHRMQQEIGSPLQSEHYLNNNNHLD